MLFGLVQRHAELSWHAYSTTDRDLFAQYGPEGPVILAQTIPQVYWRAAPLSEIDAWLGAHLPKELATAREHSMEQARLRVAERTALLPAADRYVQQLH
jgi:aminopeptidase N